MPQTDNNGSASKSNPQPRTWVTLKHPDTMNQESTAKAFCSFIEKFLWRPNDGDSEFFVVINNSNGPRNRYKYKGVPEDVFNEAWARAYAPSDYEDNFGSWYSRAIKDRFEDRRYE